MGMGTYEYACIAFGDDLYQDDVATALAEIFDIGVHLGGLTGQEIVHAFIASGLAVQFERQNPVYVAGKSASELITLLVPYVGKVKLPCSIERFERTPDYWLGWMLGVFQVRTGCLYRRIFQKVPYDELVGMYYPLHEATEERFIEALDQRLRRPLSITQLRMLRDAAGLSQAELAQKAHVGLRSIQMYEQRNKDINKAQFTTLVRLSRVLHCDAEALLEVG